MKCISVGLPKLVLVAEPKNVKRVPHGRAGIVEAWEKERGSSEESDAQSLRRGDAFQAKHWRVFSRKGKSTIETQFEVASRLPSDQDGQEGWLKSLTCPRAM
jgi:hypothetical protein